LYHLRLGQRYAAAQTYKAAKHLALACRADTGVVLSLGGKFLLQHIRPIYH